jgi:hypothetical protein
MPTRISDKGVYLVATQVRLFVSAGPDEEGAREHLGRALAELPINVGWVIKRTPDVDSVAECHLFAVVLGHDIAAPVGLELWWARRTEKSILAYTPEGLRTPACQVFYQDNFYLDWRAFPDLVTLRRLFLLDISRFLLGYSERYGVTVPEVEALRGFMARLEKPAIVVPGSAPAREGPLSKAQGAGGGGVILAPGKDTPRGARIVGEE